MTKFYLVCYGQPKKTLKGPKMSDEAKRELLSFVKLFKENKKTGSSVKVISSGIGAAGQCAGILNKNLVCDVEVLRCLSGGSIRSCTIISEILKLVKEDLCIIITSPYNHYGIKTRLETQDRSSVPYEVGSFPSIYTDNFFNPVDEVLVYSF